MTHVQRVPQRCGIATRLHSAMVTRGVARIGPLLSQAFLVLLASATLAVPNGAAQVVRGTVRAESTLTPVAAALIQVRDSAGVIRAEALSDDSGLFTLDLPAPGNYQLLVTCLGYLTHTQRLTYRGPEDDYRLLHLVLAVAPVRMDSVVVVAEAKLRHLEQAGFYDRVRMGFGHFITRDMIQRSAATRVTDLLYGYPSIRVLSMTTRGQYDVLTRARCFPTVVVDGSVVRAGGHGAAVGSWNDIIHPNAIEAIEVYSSPAGVPVQYRRDPCGALIIWSRR
jgi:hypothetical protein